VPLRGARAAHAVRTGDVRGLHGQHSGRKEIQTALQVKREGRDRGVRRSALGRVAGREVADRVHVHEQDDGGEDVQHEVRDDLLEPGLAPMWSLVNLDKSDQQRGRANGVMRTR
jgi:hypothetical protein